MSVREIIRERERGDDDYYEGEGRRSYVRPPCSFKCGEANLWVCSQTDVTNVKFLKTFESHPMVITCKNKEARDVINACRRASGLPGAGDPILFSIGFAGDRSRRFLKLLDRIKHALDGGRDVILH